MTFSPPTSMAAPWRTQLLVAGEQLRALLANAWVQRAILAAAIVFVFWDGIWAGVARNDQIIYLHHISQYDSLWDILSHSPSWNRDLADPGSEAILYRPVLYLLLGTLYYLFRYHFVAWQITSLSLHVVVVLGLHLLLLQGRLRHSVLPLLIALLFGTAYLASEMVFWNNIVGYLLFCALEVYALYFFLRFLQTDRTGFLVACCALTVVAEFTYEMGVIVNLLLAIAFLVRSFFATATDPALARGRPGADRWAALLFLVAALLLPIASLADLHARGLAFAPRARAEDLWHLMRVGGQALYAQIGFWISAWMAPTVYRVIAAERAVAVVSTAGLTGLTLLNFVALALLLAAGVGGLRRLRQTKVSKREAELALGLCMLFLLGYSMVIAVGRTAGRGLVYVIMNSYYGYVANLTVCVAIALAAAVGRARGSSEQASEPSKGRAAMVAALAALVLVNASGVRALAHAFRFDYAAPRQEVIDRVLAWREQVGNGAQRYFVVSPTCQGNDTLAWFSEILVRRDSGWKPPITLADALFPEQSANLNAARIRIPLASVDEIRCDKGALGR